MMIRTSVRVSLLAALALLVTTTSDAQAQQGLSYPPLVAGQPVYGQGMPQQAPPYSMEGTYMNAYGDDVVHPASYMQQAGYMQRAGYSQQCGPSGCAGGGGCYGGQYGGQCGNGRGGFLSNLGLISKFLCNPGSGPNTEQCGPHYFDFSAEYLHYERSKSPISDSTVISTFGITSPPDLIPIPADIIALSGGDVGGEDSNGYRLTGRLDVGALSVFEFSYSGLYNEGGNASVAQGDDLSNSPLFSVFSVFRSESGVVPSDENFAETDNAILHSVNYESELHSAEASYRRYWVGYSPRISGTLLLGFRYTHLNEEIGFFSDSGVNNGAFSGTIDIDMEADNRLAGFQTGGDVWMTVMQGLRIGGDMRVGIYNNDYQAASSAVASDGSPSTSSDLNGNQVAFLTEARLSAVMNISSTLSAKVGYEALYISDLVLAGENLTSIAPYGVAGGVDATPISTNGEAFYHGWHAGLEYIY